jgi:pimeloyl-ACP methyl ester carboxylesterase
MNLDIKNSLGERIDYSFQEGNSDSNNLVVLGHGVTGNKDRPILVGVSNALAQRGIASLRISYAGNGDSGGRFQDSNITKEVGDLGAVLDALGDSHTIAYVGHSMGGAVGALRGSSDRRIKLLVSLAGMVHTKAFAELEFGEVTPDKGFMWDDEDCPLSQSYMDDLRGIGDVLEAAKKVHTPWLFVHGTKDDVVPFQDTVDVHGAVDCPKDLHSVEGADHVFSESHLEPAVQKVAAWLEQQFSKL